MAVPEVEPPVVPIVMDMAALEQVKGLPQSDSPLEMDFFPVPIGIGERGTRPFLPWMLLVVDRELGFVLQGEFLQAEPTLEAMWGSVPLKVLRQLRQWQWVPRQVWVRSMLLEALLTPLGEELGFEIKEAADLPRLDEAKEFLLQRFT